MDYINIILISGCVVLVLVSSKVFKIDYMNCSEIIKSHMMFLTDKNGKVLIIPFLTYYLVPLIISIVLIRCGITVNSDSAETILVIISILMSAFFMIIASVLSLKPLFDNKSIDASKYSRIMVLIEEMCYTLIFEIFISTLILLLSLLCIFSSFEREIIKKIISVFMYATNMVLVINLFIIIKRFYCIIKSYFE